MTALFCIGVMITIVCYVFVSAKALTAIWERDHLRGKYGRIRLALARTLRDQQYEANQGDGIDDDLLPQFCRSCAHLGIVVTFHPDETYTLEPTFTDWLQANEGRKPIPLREQYTAPTGSVIVQPKRPIRRELP